MIEFVNLNGHEKNQVERLCDALCAQQRNIAWENETKAKMMQGIENDWDAHNAEVERLAKMWEDDYNS